MMFAGVTGHQDIPAAAVPFIRNEIARVLKRTGPGLVGVSSLAKGADQLFAKIVLELGGRLHAVIPCRGYEFAFDDDKSAAEFNSLIGVATTIERLDHSGPSQAAFYDAGKRVVQLSQLIVAVWDSHEAKGVGGTADIVAFATEHKKPIEVIWPAGIDR